MVVDVILRVFITGLVALVPVKEDGVTKLTVLLLDARSPQIASDGCFIHSHSPYLYYKKEGICDLNNRCSAKGDLCQCILDHTDIFIPTNNEESFLKIENLCQMRKVSKRANRVKEELLKKEKTDTLTDLVVARLFKMPVSDFKVVAFAGEHGNEPDPDHYFSFESLSHRQSMIASWFSPYDEESKLAEAVMVKNIHVKGIKDAHGRVFVYIDMRPFGRESPGLPLKLSATPCNSTYCADLTLINDMAKIEHESTKGYCHSMDVGRHFELYYNISKNMESSDEKPVPKLKYKKADETVNHAHSSRAMTGASDPDLIFWNEFIDEFGRAGDNRPICPLVVMSQ